MVGCKDNYHSSHRLLNTLPSASLSSPLDGQDARVTHWLHALPQPQVLPLYAFTSTLTPVKAGHHDAPYQATAIQSRPAEHPHPSVPAPSSKRKALADLEPSLPRKSARLEQRQKVSEHKMSTSPSKKNQARKSARGGVQPGIDKDDAEASVGHIATRRRSQAKVLTGSSSDKENQDVARNAVTTCPRVDDTGIGIQQIPPVAGFVPPQLGSPSKSKPPSSRPASPTKSTSTRGSKAPAKVDKRERLMLLNPPVGFFTPAYLGKLGKKIPPLVKSLWVDYIVSDDEGFIPQALKARIPQQTPNKSKPKIRASCFAHNTRYGNSDYERIWLAVTDVVKNADECRHMGYHESHWISYVVSPILNLVCNLKRFNEDERRIRALDIQTVGIDPPTLCSYSADAYFKDLDKRIDCAIGLHLSEEEILVLERGVYEMEGAVDSINQTSSFVNFTPMFLNIEVKRKHSDIDPLIQLAAWIAAEFEKRRIEHYSLNMPVLAIEIEGDRWGLYMVYADEDLVGADSYGLKFVGPVPLGDTSSLQGCFKLLDGLSRCADWGVGKYKAWFREEKLNKYLPIKKKV